MEQEIVPAVEVAAPNGKVDRAALAASVIADLDAKGGVAKIEGVDAPVGEKPSVVAENATTEPKIEPLAPRVAAIARDEARIQAQKQEFKAEKEAFHAERTKWESEKGKPEEIHRKIASDVVAWADEQKLTPQQRYEMARALSFSYQPEDKRPADWRGAQSRVLTEVEQSKAEVAKVRAELEAYKGEQAKAASEATQAQKQRQVSDHIAAAAGEATPLVKAYLEAEPETARGILWQIANNMTVPDGQTLTAEMVVAEYEKFLESKLAWSFKAKQATGGTKDSTSTATKGHTSPPTLSNRATASPTREQAKPRTAEERRLDAIAYAESLKK